MLWTVVIDKVVGAFVNSAQFNVMVNVQRLLMKDLEIIIGLCNSEVKRTLRGVPLLAPL